MTPLQKKRVVAYASTFVVNNMDLETLIQCMENVMSENLSNLSEDELADYFYKHISDSPAELIEIMGAKDD